MPLLRGKEGRIKGAKLTSHNKMNLSRMDNDHGIGTKRAMEGDHEIEQEWPVNGLSPLDADSTNQRS